MQVVSGAYLGRGQFHLGQVKTGGEVEVQGFGQPDLTVDIESLSMIVPDYELIVAVLVCP